MFIEMLAFALITGSTATITALAALSALQ